MSVKTAYATAIATPVITECATSTGIQKILMILRARTGHDFASYKKNTITNRIDRRLAFHQHSDYAQYINFLSENPEKIDFLFNELLIGVTRFFRDAQAFEILKAHLITLIAQKKDTDPIRIWVAGCSTGEEAYSVGMLVLECLEILNKKKLPLVQIFATDLDANAIAHARRGIYHESTIADIQADRIARFFTRHDDTYQVNKELRDSIVFVQHNLVKDAPFTRLDLLCCRNVMIYFAAELQKKIIPIFHYSLNKLGLMFTGPAETINGRTEMFAVIDNKWKIFERKEALSQLNKISDFQLSADEEDANTLVDQLEQALVDTRNKLKLANEQLQTVKKEMQVLNEQLLVVKIQQQIRADKLLRFDNLHG